jgi:hypothetical protein
MAPAGSCAALSPPPILGPTFPPGIKVTKGSTKDCREEIDLAQMQGDSAMGIVLSSLVPGLV